MSNTGQFYTDYEFSYPNNNARVLTSSLQEVPSNKKPLINLTANGILLPSTDIYILKLKFLGPGPEKDQLSYPYGTFCIGKKVLNATKVLKMLYNRTEQELEIIVDVKSYCPIRRVTRFSFAVQINDCGGPCITPVNAPPVCVEGWKCKCISEHTIAGITFRCTNDD